MNLDQQLADAFYACAIANHYMVGIVYAYDDQTLLDAYQITIDREGDPAFDAATLDLTLDLMEHAKRVRKLG